MTFCRKTTISIGGANPNRKPQIANASGTGTQTDLPPQEPWTPTSRGKPPLRKAAAQKSCHVEVPLRTR